jgi:hypothetical protein
LHLNENASNKLVIKKKLFNNSYSFQNEKHKKYYGNDENMIKLSKTIKNIYDNGNVGQNETFNNNDGNKSRVGSKTPVNSYKRRLRLIKNRLLKTKNSLFAKKRKMFHIKSFKSNSQESNGPNIDHNRTLNRNNQSFVENVRSRFNSLKRNNDNNEGSQTKKLKIY